MGWTFIEIQRGEDLVMLPNSQAASQGEIEHVMICRLEFSCRCSYVVLHRRVLEVIGTTVVQIGRLADPGGAAVVPTRVVCHHLSPFSCP